MAIAEAPAQAETYIKVGPGIVEMSPRKLADAGDKPETAEPQIDSAAVIKFVEGITGRKIRERTSVNLARIQEGKTKLHGDSMDHYIGLVNDAFRDHEFDVIAGSGYVRRGSRVERAIELLIRPGLSDLDKGLLAGSIPSAVPLNTPIVYKEWNRLTPDAKMNKRVTHTSHRFISGDNPRLRMP